MRIKWKHQQWTYLARHHLLLNEAARMIKIGVSQGLINRLLDPYVQELNKAFLYLLIAIYQAFVVSFYPSGFLIYLGDV